MTGEDRRNFLNIVSRRWKEIKEDSARLSAYNDRARQMKIEAEKLGNDSRHEKTVAERSEVKEPKESPKVPEFVDTDSDTNDEQEPVVKQAKRAPKPPEFIDTNSDTKDEKEPAVKRRNKVPKFSEFVATNSDTEDEEEQEPAVKQPKKGPKSPGPVRMESDVSGNSDTEDNLRALVFPIDKSLEVGKNEEKLVLRKRIYRGKNIICC